MPILTTRAVVQQQFSVVLSRSTLLLNLRKSMKRLALTESMEAHEKQTLQAPKAKQPNLMLRPLPRHRKPLYRQTKRMHHPHRQMRLQGLRLRMMKKMRTDQSMR